MNYETVNLAFNLSGGGFDGGAAERACNPGGSTICWTPTRGCGTGAMTCVGTSTKLTSLEATVSLPPNELEKLQKELSALMAKYAKGK